MIVEDTKSLLLQDVCHCPLTHDHLFVDHFILRNSITVAIGSIIYFTCMTESALRMRRTYDQN